MLALILKRYKLKAKPFPIVKRHRWFNCSNSSSLKHAISNHVLPPSFEPWAIIILEQAARYITRYIDHLVSHGYHNITLMGGTAEKITPWLSTKAQGYLCDAHYLPEQGAIQLAKRLA
ncbi:hypothetical protein P4S66_01155 [Pseudoalteromonas sp. B129b]